MGAWVSRVCGSQGGQDKSCMTEGVERDIADDSKREMDFWGFALDGGGRWSEKTQRAKAPNRLRQSTQEPGQWGGGGGSKT